MLPEKAKRGRPVATKTLLTQMMRERIAQKIAEKLDPIIDAQISAAIGNLVLTRTDFKGRKSVSELAPDTNAARLLFEHSIGKPKETIQYQGAIGIVALVAQLEREGREN
jgi:hypothetical protein